MIGRPYFKFTPEYFECLKTERQYCVELSYNIFASHVLRQYPEFIEWNPLSVNEGTLDIIAMVLDSSDKTECDDVIWAALLTNKNAIHLIERNLHKLECHWGCLSKNPNAMHILEKNMDMINDLSDWYLLSSNPNAISLLEKYPEKINWKTLSTNPNAIHILEKNIDKINWHHFALNPNSLQIFKQNPNFMSKLTNSESMMELFSSNDSPEAIEILKQHLDMVDWDNISKNKSAISIIEQNMEKISPLFLGLNKNARHLLEVIKEPVPTILSRSDAFGWVILLDRERMYNEIKEFRQELVRYVMSPGRLTRMAWLHGIEMMEYVEIFEM